MDLNTLTLRIVRIVIIYITASWVIHHDVQGQQHEIGFGLGGATYTGDIIRRIDPSQVGIQGTLFGRRNFDNAWSLRGGISVARLNAADSVAPIDPVALVRNAHFQGTMVEISAIMEFHFLDYMAHQATTRFSPFGFFGLGYGLFMANGQGHQGDPTDTNYRVGGPVIPFGLGVKYKLKDRVLVSLEGGARATFTDALDKIGNEGIYYPRFTTDPSTGTQALNPNGLNFGNNSDRDWYYFLGITISYSFHQVKCFN